MRRNIDRHSGGLHTVNQLYNYVNYRLMYKENEKKEGIREDRGKQ